MGGSGDLSQRKLLPALLDLYTRGKLPDVFHIIGFARSPRTHDEFREFVKKAINTHDTSHEHPEETVNGFCERVSYVAGSFDDESSYHSLSEALASFDTEHSVATNKLFYLAVPPKYYGQIFSDLKDTSVADEAPDRWTHILVEKPFGHDLETAQELDQKLASLYREDQIFRIDHYLAKEAVQNILSFRFANTLLQASWNKDSVESVHIKMHEKIDVGDRTGFYEGVGALRDVGQNHLLQILALVALREPQEFTVDAVRAARSEVLEALAPADLEKLNETIVRAQYECYEAKTDSGEDSQTETYFSLKTKINLPEWEGVPFCIEAGKALAEAEVSVTIKLKDVATGLFETKSCLSVGNEIKLTISPEQTIDITLNAKSPGLGYQLETRTLSFTCQKGEEEIKNSYEKVLYDSIIGDQTLFTQTSEVLAAWKYITPILENWHTLPLHTYEKGSNGPDVTLANQGT